MTASRSLMDFIQTPVLVGDPDGRVVYVNPALETDFLLPSDEIVGHPLANLFEGGGREAMLLAVAQVCTDPERDSARFGLMVGERGYKALVSAVEAEGGRVGVIVLLSRESTQEIRLQSFRREILAPLDEISACLTALADESTAPAVRNLGAEAGFRCVERMRKWAEQLAATLTGEDD